MYITIVVSNLRLICFFQVYDDRLYSWSTLWSFFVKQLKYYLNCQWTLEPHSVNIAYNKSKETESGANIACYGAQNQPEDRPDLFSDTSSVELLFPSWVVREGRVNLHSTHQRPSCAAARSTGHYETRQAFFVNFASRLWSNSYPFTFLSNKKRQRKAECKFFLILNQPQDIRGSTRYFVCRPVGPIVTLATSAYDPSYSIR